MGGKNIKSLMVNIGLLKVFSLNISLPLGRIAIFCYFISYGYYGALSPQGSGFSSDMWPLVISGLLTLPLIYYFYLSRDNPTNLLLNGNFGYVDLIIFVVISVFLLILTWPQLDFWLYSDEISYSSTAHAHAIKIGLLLVAKIPAVGLIPFKWLVQIISISLLSTIFLAWKLTAKKEGLFKKNALILFFLILRLAFFINGGNGGNPHPPMELFPLLVAGSIIGIVPAAFKLIIFIANLIFLLLLYRLVSQKLEHVSAIIITLIAATMPIVLDLSTVVEHSYWGYFFTTLVIFYIATTSNIDFEKLIYFIAIGTLFRQPVFLLMVPVLYLYITSNMKLQLLVNINSLRLLLPTILFLPFLLKSFLIGTPATGAMNAMIQPMQVWIALNSGYVFDEFVLSYGVIWLVPLLCSFILTQKKFHVTLSLALLFLSQLLIFYSIHPGLWNLKKYQAELFAPFLLVGLYYIFLYAENIKFLKKILFFCGIMLVAINITRSHKFLENTTIDNSKYLFNLPSISYKYREPYDYILSKKKAANTLSIGSTYGIFSEIMAGYNGFEIQAAKAIYDKNKPILDSSLPLLSKVKALNDDMSIQIILVQSLASNLFLIKALTEYGWSLRDRYFDEFYKTEVFLFERN